MTALLALGIIGALTYSFEIVFGLGGTILLLPLLSPWFDAKTLVIFSAFPQLLVGSIGLAGGPRRVAPKVLSGMLLFAALGGVAGTWLFYYASAGLFQVLLGSSIILFGVYLLARPRPPRLHVGAARALDTLAGFSQALFGISGPVAMTRLFGTFTAAADVRAYALAFFLAMNALRAAGYLVTGAITREIALMIAVAAPFLLIALPIANRWHAHVNERWFRRVIAVLVLAGGVSLLARV